MNKTLVFAALILFAACAAPSTNRETTNTNSNATAAKPSAAPLTEAEAIAKEKQIWETIEKKNYNAFADMVDEQAISVSNDVNDKAAIVKEVSGFVPADLVLSDWKFLSLDKDAAVVVYKANYKGTMNGQPLPPQAAYVTTAWVNRNGKWLAIFHQESDILKAPPAPPAKPAKAAPSPATAGTPPTMSSDVIANEKVVWDALRTRNYDAFASFLAPESIEVEPYGITDKAGSVKGVQDYDLSKTELSDWKTVRFDDDASLVTYVTRNPGQKPERERHTTIWVHRGGKWLAVFHQGTQIVPPPPAPSSTTK